MINTYLQKEDREKSESKEKSILELGCGTGKHTYELQKLGFDVFGVDFSESMLKKARKLGIKGSYGDVRTYRIEKNLM